MLSGNQASADETKTEMSHLPDELVAAVLSHIPVNEAGKYCLVSKLWCSILRGDIQFEKLLQRLSDLALCKQVTVTELAEMIAPFIQNTKCKARLFIPLKQLEAEVIDISANPLFRAGDKAELRMKMDEFKELMLRHFGVVAFFHGYTAQCILGYNGKESRAKESAPFAVLEYLLQEGKGKVELELVNKLIAANIVKLSGLLVFKNKELCMTSEDNEVTSITKVLEDVLPSLGHMLRYNVSEFKFLVGMYAGNIIERIDAAQGNNAKMKL